MREYLNLVTGRWGRFAAHRIVRASLLSVRLTVLAFCLPFGSAPAASAVVVVALPNPDTTTNFALSAIVRLSLRDNPELRRFRARRDASLDRPMQEKSLPNPMFNFSGIDRVSESTWSETKERRVGVQQEFPGFGKRDLRAEIAAQDAEISEYDLEAAARNVVREVKEASFDLISMQRVIALTRQDDAVLEHLAELAASMAVAGSRSQQDVLAAHAAAAQHRQRLQELVAREVALRVRLNALMNRRAGAPLIVSEIVPGIPETGSIEGLLALAAANRPEIRAAEIRVRRCDLENQLKTRDAIPDYKLGLQYRRDNNSDELVMLTFGLNLPFWHRKDAAGMQEADRLKAACVAEKETIERTCAREVQEAHARLLAARRTQDRYCAELIPQAQSRFKADEAAYHAGRLDFHELLASQGALLDARALAIMAEGDVGTKVVRLEQAVGVEMLK